MERPLKEYNDAEDRPVLFDPDDLLEETYDDVVPTGEHLGSRSNSDDELPY